MKSFNLTNAKIYEHQHWTTFNITCRNILWIYHQTSSSELTSNAKLFLEAVNHKMEPQAGIWYLPSLDDDDDDDNDVDVDDDDDLKKSSQIPVAANPIQPVPVILSSQKFFLK